MNSFDFLQCEDVYLDDWTDWKEQCDEDGNFLEN